MNVIAFDIETTIDQQLFADFAPPLKVAVGNLRDPAKIAEKHAEAATKQRELAALDPQVSRVLSWHVAQITSSSVEPKLRTEIRLPSAPEITTAQRERNLLSLLWALLSTADRIVTFNGASFDVPFIERRSLLIGVTPSIKIETHKYHVIDGKSNHIDVRRVLTETQPGAGLSDFVPGDLNYWSRVLLGDTRPDELAPGEIVRLWQAGDYARIAQYGERDALRTLQMYQRLDGFYFN